MKTKGEREGERGTEPYGERKVITKHYLACVTSLVTFIAILCLVSSTPLVFLLQYLLNVLHACLTAAVSPR